MDMFKGVASLDFHGRPAREIEFYPMHFFSKKMPFPIYIYNLGFQVALWAQAW